MNPVNTRINARTDEIISPEKILPIISKCRGELAESVSIIAESLVTVALTNPCKAKMTARME